ncbi:SAE2-domain-containing protein [Annulohypoxylon stygium]|nr:SAE2-domain-containing protein [Annulohypoxylon stygium]
MENWFKEVGRPALFDAVAGACDQIGAELNSRLEENTRLSAEIEQLRNKVSDADQLREENRSLQREIQNLKDGRCAETSLIDLHKHQNDSRNPRPPLAPKSVNQVSNPKQSIDLCRNKLDGLKFSELKEEHLKLGGNYTKLREKYSELEDAHTKLNRRLRDITKAYNQWMDHANQLNDLCQKRSRTIKKLEAKLSAAATGTSTLSNATFSSDSSVPPERRQLVASELARPDAHTELGLIKPVSVPRESPLLWPPVNANSAHDEPRSTISSPEPRFDPAKDATLRSEGQISTQEEEEDLLPPLPHDRSAALEEVPIKHEPSSDAPVIVSERCLRKRKHDDNQAGGSRVGTKVKTEENDSDPGVINERRQFVPHESIDFDAEGGRVDTPRKRNKISAMFYDTSSSDDVSGLVKSPLARSHPSLLQRSDRNSTGARITVRAVRDLRTSSPSALKTLDRSTRPREGPRINIRAQKNESSALCNGISSLSEDGDQYDTASIDTEKPSKSDRLRYLLNNSPRNGTITPSKSSLSELVMPSRYSESRVPQRRELPFGKTELMPFEKRVEKTIPPPKTLETTSRRRASTNSVTKKSTGRPSERRSIGNVVSDATPLRARPKSQLGIKDFKVNPDANEGYDFAFTDVVRNKNERNSLTGCVREDCCGPAFRLQARAQRGQIGALDFQTLLEKYLGDDAWRLSTMTRLEKEDLWVEAKTQELANEQGKHRHRFHRAASPPGYWRTDFPSTQEEERDKEESAKMTRQIVEERYREAMRPGGRWLFRDE